MASVSRKKIPVWLHWHLLLLVSSSLWVLVLRYTSWIVFVGTFSTCTFLSSQYRLVFKHCCIAVTANSIHKLFFLNSHHIYHQVSQTWDDVSHLTFIFSKLLWQNCKRHFYGTNWIQNFHISTIMIFFQNFNWNTSILNWFPKFISQNHATTVQAAFKNLKKYWQITAHLNFNLCNAISRASTKGRN